MLALRRLAPSLLLALPSFLDGGTILGRQFVGRHASAVLECPDVRDDAPTVVGGDLRGVVGHGPVSVRDDVKHLADRHGAPPFVVIRRWFGIAALYDHAVTLAAAPVADRAVNVEPLPATLDHR